MTKKHKFIDTFKSWLLTLGVASVFGLAALGVNASKTYTKTSAFEYEDNGTLIFNVVNTYDINLLCNYYCSYFNYVEGTSSCFFDTDTLGLSFDDVSIVANTVDTSYIDYVIFGQYDGQGEFSFSRDDPIEDWYFDSNDTGIDFNNLIILPSYEGYQSLRNYVLSYNAPQSEGSFLTALTDFMQLLGGAIVQLAQPVANGVTEFARDLFIDNSSLSIMGGIIGIFAGIALAVGITTKVYQWVTSLGN